MEKVIEVNLGVGMNQLFPETTKIVIEVEDVENKEDLKNSEKNNEEVVRHVKWDL
jgi:hypothetical protein